MATKSKISSPSRNQVRIGGGQWRSRILAFPEVAGLRPTGDRIRQTAFNWLGQSLHGKACLDAFAGSGALGFEAASRGAERVVLCEANLTAVGSLRENVRRLEAAQCDVRAQDVFEWLKSNRLKFDVVFCDPPFDANLHAAFLAALLPHLAADASVYVESNQPLGALVSDAGGYALVKSRKAGTVYFGLLRPLSTG